MQPKKDRMRNIFFILLIIAGSNIVHGQNPVDFNCYKSHINSVNNFNPSNTDFSDLEFLRDILKNRRIVILGESDHGDGLTFEAKTRIIKFLVDELGFNTLALEGAGFWETYFANKKLKDGKDLFIELNNCWLGLWTLSNQTKPLIEYIQQKKETLKLWGIDNQSENNYFPYFPLILNNLVGNQAFNSIDFNSFKENYSQHRNYLYSKSGDSTKQHHLDYPSLRKDLKIIKKNLSSISSPHAPEMIQGVINIEKFFDQMELNFGSYQDQNNGINMRDGMMAENLNWLINQDPDRKIIIWTANFHAAHNLDQVIYKDDDDFYQIMKPLGHRLKTKYGDKVYSIAFTSVEGETAMFYEKEAHIIQVEKDSWEFELSKQIKDSYAFINFESIRSEPNCSTKSFKSSILGYRNRPGKWFNVFDGVFFIRTMKRSEIRK